MWEPDEVTRRLIGMKIILLATAALLAVTLAGCGDEDPTTMANDDPAGLSPDDLNGRAFASVRVDGRQLVNGTQVRLGFADDEVRANAGCNHLFGTIALDGDTLTASNIGGTEMGCPDGLNDQDVWLSEFLSAGPDSRPRRRHAHPHQGRRRHRAGRAGRARPADGGGDEEPTSNDGGSVVGSGCTRAAAAP